MDEVEDESHLIFNYTFYSEFRKTFSDKRRSIIQVDPKDSYDFIKTLFTTENNKATYYIANYISKCFTKRKDIIHPSQN